MVIMTLQINVGTLFKNGISLFNSVFVDFFFSTFCFIFTGTLQSMFENVLRNLNYEAT